jgi:hypothetical protein
MPNNYVLLDRIELNATAASVTFDNIPQSGYTDLKVVVSSRTSRSGNPEDEVFIRFNGTTTGYSSRSLFGTGAATSSNTGGTAQINRTWTTANGATSNTFGSMDIYIPNYRGSQNKSVSVDAVSENNATTAYAVLTAGLWSNSAAITSITLLPEVGPNFLTGSTFSLYGLAQVGTTPAIAPKADGGNVIGTDGTYWYHAFLGNGTFTPQVGLSCDVLTIAGGGGGGGFYAAPGGGAGGLLYSSSTSVVINNYAVTVGAGGTGGNSTSFTNGTQGINSSFIGGAVSLTALGGGLGVAVGVGASGGSGGGGGANDSAGGAGTSGQGFAGGSHTTTLGGKGGGGGGAGVAGQNGTVGAAGGAGLNTYSSWATATNTGASGFYAGGGGGGTQTQTPGAGGAGGGGAGAYGNNSGGYAATGGTSNTGGGGGGGGSQNGTTSIFNGASGGSGIVIIRYLVA